MFLSARRRKVVVGIASPSEAVEVKIVEQQSLVIHRLHRNRLVEKPRAGLQIDQGVVHIAAAGHVGGTVAHLDRGVNQVSAAGHSFGFGGRTAVDWSRTRVGVCAKTVSDDETIRRTAVPLEPTLFDGMPTQTAAELL